jgi:DNA-binding CsgD family transcriptional regulator
LQADRVGILFATRNLTGVAPLLGDFESLDVGGLQRKDAESLLTQSVGRPLAVAATDRIVDETEGCPLALIELARDHSAHELERLALFPEPLPIGRQLEPYYVRQYDALPEDTRTLLLLRAADSSKREDTLLRAAELLGVPPDADAPAIDAGLLEARGWLRFRHPLVLSAVYSGAPTTERRRVHKVLAEVTDPDEMPERVAWHWAAASTGPDESVAARLESVASSVRARGGLAAEVTFLSRAADLTPDQGERRRRLMDAAQAALVAGLRPRAAALLREASDVSGGRPPLVEARIRRLQALLNWSGDLLVDAASIHFETAQAIESIDIRSARDLYMDALEAARLSGSLTRNTSPQEIARAALAAPMPPGDPTVSDAILEATATRIAIGFEASVPLFRAVIDELSSSEPSSSSPTRWGLNQVYAAWDMWDADRARAMLDQTELRQRSRGELDSLRVTLLFAAQQDLLCGDLRSAAACSAEALAVVAAIEGEGPRFSAWKATGAARLAWQGRDTEARDAISVLLSVGPAGQPLVSRVTMGLYALLILEMARGNFAKAYAAGWQLFETDAPPNGNLALSWLVEAALRTGNKAAAQSAMDRMTERATASGTPWAMGLLARAEALTSIPEHAEPLFVRSLSLLTESPIRTDLAYTHLVYGEWLRRQKRRGDARRELRSAREMFEEMDGHSFADRAAHELTLAGEHSPIRRGRYSFDLTPQQEQIARLASQGDTNSEIAARLFISANTVDYHLRNVFRKLGVSSRRELREALSR